MSEQEIQKEAVSPQAELDALVEAEVNSVESVEESTQPSEEATVEEAVTPNPETAAVVETKLETPVDARFQGKTQEELVSIIENQNSYVGQTKAELAQLKQEIEALKTPTTTPEDPLANIDPDSIDIVKAVLKQEREAKAQATESELRSTFDANKKVWDSALSNPELAPLVRENLDQAFEALGKDYNERSNKMVSLGPNWAQNVINTALVSKAQGRDKAKIESSKVADRKDGAGTAGSGDVAVSETKDVASMSAEEFLASELAKGNIQK